MPYLSITANVALDAECEKALANDAAKVLSETLGKPQAYIMVAVQPVRVLQFAGSGEPAAFLDLKSIGYPHDLSDASAGLSKAVERHTGIPSSRVYIAFDDFSASRWAHAGDTFA